MKPSAEQALLQHVQLLAEQVAAFRKVADYLIEKTRDSLLRGKVIVPGAV